MSHSRKVSPEDFIKVWMQAVKDGRNSHWVAEMLSMPVSTVSSRANGYRKSGVRLPRLSSKVDPRLHVEQYNRLIDELK